MIRYLEINQGIICKYVTGNLGNARNSAESDLGQILRKKNWNSIVIL